MRFNAHGIAMPVKDISADTPSLKFGGCLLATAKGFVATDVVSWWTWFFKFPDLTQFDASDAGGITV